MWLQKVQDLGDIKANIRINNIVFKHDENTAILKNSNGNYQISVSCGCTGVNYNPASRELRVNYNPGAIPLHIKSEGIKNYKTNKVITVMCKDIASNSEVKELLIFTANIFE